MIVLVVFAFFMWGACTFVGLMIFWRMGFSPIWRRIKVGVWHPTPFQELYMTRAKGKLPLGVKGEKYIQPLEAPMVDAIYWCFLGAIMAGGGGVMIYQMILSLK